MDGSAPADVSACRRGRGGRRLPAFMSVLVFAGVGTSPAQQTQEPEKPQETPAVVQMPDAKPAVWRIREVRFLYSSSKAIYSCSALQARVESILLAVGARDGIEVKADSCSEVLLEDDFEEIWERDARWRRERARLLPRDSAWEDPYDRLQGRGKDREQRAYVKVRLQIPVEVTPAVLAEIERDKSRRELVSRVTRDPAAKMNDPVLFAARWQPVTLSRESIGLKPEECELLDQMSSSVFKELDLRVIDKGPRCSQFGVSRIAPSLTVQALLSAPIGATSLPQIPTSEGESATSAPAQSQ